MAFSDEDKAKFALELEEQLRAARGGNAESARRVAELYEIFDDAARADTWWHEAAKLENPDAKAYVEHILSW